MFLPSWVGAEMVGGWVLEWLVDGCWNGWLGECSNSWLVGGWVLKWLVEWVLEWLVSERLSKFD